MLFEKYLFIYYDAARNTFLCINRIHEKVKNVKGGKKMRWWKITVGLLLAGLAAGWYMEQMSRRERRLQTSERLKKFHLFF